jgi:hypothetical protein
MKLKNNSVEPKVIHYISTQGGRRIVTLETNGVVEINDCVRIINEIEIEHKWVSIVDETSIPEANFPEDKMEKASKDVESYISEPESDLKVESESEIKTEEIFEETPEGVSEEVSENDKA